MANIDEYGPKVIGLFLLFASSIVLAVGLNFYFINGNYLAFLIPFAVWLMGSLFSIRFLNKSALIEIRKAEGK